MDKIQWQRDMSKSGGVPLENELCNETGLEENTVTRENKDIRHFRQPTQSKTVQVLLLS